ncbi:MAG: aminotransferase class V-fold PLP-dependent enzyme, partial [Proteobacteria bacterium]|nr:aminotransferase class V-fold PLP-dependent enzyme [Pseudomonadota bacterium]
WEAAFSNVLSKGDKVLVLESGRFAVGWGEMARFMGAEVEVLPGSLRRAVDPAKVEARLKADKGHTIKAIMVVQIDTASSCVNDIPAIRRAIDAAKHPALLMVDGVASIGCMPFEMDKWGIDVAMAGSQKGLMTPPGLAFVAASPKAKAVSKKAGMRTMYWDWAAREGEVSYQKYCGTPPEHLLFALRKAIDLLFAEGMENAFRRHALLAQATQRAVAKWAEGQVLAFCITEPSERSPSVTNVLVQGQDPQPILNYAREKCGVVVGVGLGELAGKAFRIAHMGHANAPMLFGTLGALEMALKALKIPHGAGGLDAAVNYLGSEVAA